MKEDRATCSHEERIRFVQEAAAHYYDGEAGSPPPLNRDFMKQSNAQKKASHRKRYAAIAAVAAMVFLTGSIVSSVMEKNVAYGDKGLIHRLYKAAGGGLHTDKQDEIPLDEPVDYFHIERMEDIGDAVYFADGELYVPEYIPEGYELESLDIQGYVNGDMDVMYKFKKGADSLNMTEMYFTEDSQVDAGGKGDLIKLDDRAIYVRDKHPDGYLCIDVYTDDAAMQIGGKITKAEGFKIAENLKKRD